MKRVLFIVLAVVTVVLSVIFSQVYFNLALKLVPPANLSEVSRGAGRVVFAGWGVILGLVAALLEGILLWVATRPRR